MPPKVVAFFITRKCKINYAKLILIISRYQLCIHYEKENMGCYC